MILKELKLFAKNIDTNLLYRSSGKVDIVNNGIRLHKDSSLSFDTYLNSFSLNKWFCYTIVDSFTVNIKLQGAVKVEFFTTSIDKKETVKIRELIVENLCEEKFSKDLTEGIFFLKITALNDSCIITKAYIHTSIHPNRPINIAAIMCTFKREKYVDRNLELIQKEILDNSLLKDHFRVIVVDNGSSYYYTNQSESINVIANKNTGGAGGFTRGLIEVLEDKKSYSHAIFIDDDVELYIPAFYLLYSFLSYLKPEYHEYFIGGSMLRTDYKHIQQERSAYWSGNSNFISPIDNNIDLRSYSNVVNNERIENIMNQFAPWWLCCIPLKDDLKNNLPFPYFIRGDDSEYSFRRSKVIINLNGFFIWHEPFEGKGAGYLNSYYKVRNYTITKNIHFEPYTLLGFIKYINALIKKYIGTLDYNSALLTIKAANDYLDNIAFFEKIDPEKNLSEIRALDEKWIESDTPFTKQFIDFLKHADQSSRLNKILQIISINGLLIPRKLFKEKGLASIYGDRSLTHFYFRYSEVRVYNHAKGKMVIRYFSKKRLLFVMYKKMLLIFRLLFLYKVRTKNLQEKYIKLNNIVFWKKYLNIEEVDS